ncbi:hypothetical protein [Actinoplanes sp. NPDC051851]|uniref:hypothetical protein n=1 Tax=Actinoplanes sp. NPDC051851 TaxID=3154753 RepID=UPI003420B04E
MDDTSLRTWLRPLIIGVSCAPLAAITVLHTMGRSGDFGLLGKWYVMVPLAVAGYFAWTLIEKAIAWSTREKGQDAAPE